MSESDEPLGEGLWARLRRRKVVQWGIAYVAAGWGLLQGLEYLSAVFGWPDQLQRLATVGFLVGAPVALVLAWYHGDRGHQKVSGIEFAILTVLLLIGGGLFWWVGRMPEPPAGTVAGPSAVQAPAVAEAGTSIAVLPFVNMSDDKGNEYFSDGISEELLNVLVRVEGLGVASRTSSFGYKGSPLGTSEIARALKVNHILEGSVRKSGNRVRITAQLIDAVHDRHLWSETYDRELTDIFAIQEGIANAIVDALRGQLGTAKPVPAVAVRADTENLEAYELYLKARELFITRRDLPESVRLFERVTQLDPEFARGWEELAAAYAVMPSWGYLERDYVTLADQAAHRALELDPKRSMAWAALGLTARAQLPADWAASLELLDRAIALDPNNGTAFLSRSINWLNLGFFDRAIADLDHCLKLDPGYGHCSTWKAFALLKRGEAGRAIELFEQSLLAGHTAHHQDEFLAAAIRGGERMLAVMLLEARGVQPELTRILVTAISDPAAAHPPARQVLEADYASADDPASRGVSATSICVWLGDFDCVADDETLDATNLLHWQPEVPAFRNSPAFKKIITRLGVDAYWRQHGFPPQCRAVGEKDFACN